MHYWIWQTIPSFLMKRRRKCYIQRTTVLWFITDYYPCPNDKGNVERHRKSSFFGSNLPWLPILIKLFRLPWSDWNKLYSKYGHFRHGTPHWAEATFFAADWNFPSNSLATNENWLSLLAMPKWPVNAVSTKPTIYSMPVNSQKRTKSCPTRMRRRTIPSHEISVWRPYFWASDWLTLDANFKPTIILPRNIPKRLMTINGYESLPITRNSWTNEGTNLARNQPRQEALQKASCYWTWPRSDIHFLWQSNRTLLVLTHGTTSMSILEQTDYCLVKNIPSSLSLRYDLSLVWTIKILNLNSSLQRTMFVWSPTWQRNLRTKRSKFLVSPRMFRTLFRKSNPWMVHNRPDFE